jgi:hypothetical protein
MPWTSRVSQARGERQLGLVRPVSWWQHVVQGGFVEEATWEQCLGGKAGTKYKMQSAERDCGSPGTGSWGATQIRMWR